MIAVALMLLLMGCGEVSVGKPTSEPRVSSTVTPEPGSSEVRATATPVAAEPTIESVALSYNLPITLLTDATGLYASPRRDDLITPGEIPAGEKVYAMGRNATSSHLRVVWNTSVGWLPTPFTDFNGRQDQLARLPVFEQEPPQCAIPVKTQSSLNATWTSDRKQRVAVVIDIFRESYGDFPKSTLALTVNDTVVQGSRRDIIERGQFSLKDVVFSLPQRIQEGEILGYEFESTSKEPLTFIATIFSVPNNCQWDT
jgi:hypothetical protein